MKIACIGWGSLIWDPKQLPLNSHWYVDGPLLPVEFARVSLDGRLTLVLTEGALLVPTLWATMNCTSLLEARTALCNREGIPSPGKHGIGSYPSLHDMQYPYTASTAAWAENRGIDVVVWTALTAKFGEVRGQVPSEDEAVKYLTSLGGDKRKLAEAYIRNAPHQIATRYRAAFEMQLGWTPNAVGLME